MLFKDETKTIDIKIYNQKDIEWTADFFQVGTLKSEESENGNIIYRVDDVDYLLEQADDLENHIGDYQDETEECYYEYKNLD